MIKKNILFEKPNKKALVKILDNSNDFFELIKDHIKICNQYFEPNIDYTQNGQIKALEIYRKALVKDIYVAEYKYSKLKIYGRMYSHGLQSFSRPIRQTLCCDDNGIPLYNDYDMRASSLTILKNICMRYNIPHNIINTILDNYTSLYKENKVDIIKIIHNTPQRYEKKILIDFQNEMDIIYECFREKYNDIYNKIKRDKKKENKMGSLCSEVCCKIENEIINCAFKYIESKNKITYAVKIFDGFMLDINTMINLEELNMYIKENLDYTIEFVIKPFEDVVDLSNFKTKSDIPLDKENGDTILEYFKGKIFRTEKGLMIYNEESGIWCNSENDYYHLIMKIDLYNPFNKNIMTLIKDALAYVNVVCPKNMIFGENDTQIGYLLFNNGVLDMKNYTMLPKDPKYHFVKKINRNFYVDNYDYNELKKRVFDVVFRDNQDGNMKKECFIRYLAYGIAGDYKIKKFLCGIGETNCGKGILNKLLRSSFEEYIGKFNAENILSGDNITDEKSFGWLINIYNTRIAISSEMDSKKNKISCNKIKRIIGNGDFIRARNLFENSLEFINKSMLMILVNDIPHIDKKDDDAYIDRACYITFDKSSKLITDDDYDGDIHFEKDNSIEEYVNNIDTCNAFIKFICDEYRKPLIKKPDIVQNDTQEITGNADVNIKKWLIEHGYKIHSDWKKWRIGNDDRYENYGKYYVIFDELYNEYKLDNPISKNKFGRDLSKICGLTRKRINNQTIIIRIGIYKDDNSSEEEI
jgi:phage/plasmid-associated DNA primase